MCDILERKDGIFKIKPFFKYFLRHLKLPEVRVICSRPARSLNPTRRESESTAKNIIPYTRWPGCLVGL